MKIRPLAFYKHVFFLCVCVVFLFKQLIIIAGVSHCIVFVMFFKSLICHYCFKVVVLLDIYIQRKLTGGKVYQPCV